jgi:hypothetical protein
MFHVRNIKKQHKIERRSGDSQDLSGLGKQLH